MKLLPYFARLTALRLLLPRDQFLDPRLWGGPVLATRIKIREYQCTSFKGTPREDADRVVFPYLMYLSQEKSAEQT